MLSMKNWCFWTVVLKKTLESPLDCKEIQPVRPKGDQSWVFIGRTDAEAETPILWPPDAKNWLIGKDPDAGKDWRKEEKGTTEGEMVGWHHRLDGHEFEQALGVGDWWACCNPWGQKELDMTERLNWSVSCAVLWTVSSLDKTLLAFSLLHFALQGQTCLLLQVCLNFLLLHSNPLRWKGHLFLVLVLEGLVGLHRLVTFSFFDISGWGTDLDYWCPLLSILVHYFLRCRHSLLPSPIWPHPIYLDSWT